MQKCVRLPPNYQQNPCLDLHDQGFEPFISIVFFSDIDLVVLGEWKHLPLFTLEQALLQKGITDRANIKVLDKASVCEFFKSDCFVNVEPYCTQNGQNSFWPF